MPTCSRSPSLVVIGGWHYTTSAGDEIVVMCAGSASEAFAWTLSQLPTQARITQPTPTAVGAPALTSFLDRVPDDVLVVVDEAYHHYTDPVVVPDALAAFADQPNVVVTRTFSKPRRAALTVAERDRVAKELAVAGYDVPPSQANFVWLPLAMTRLRCRNIATPAVSSSAPSSARACVSPSACRRKTIASWRCCRPGDPVSSSNTQP